jgi:hypothetical protein
MKLYYAIPVLLMLMGASCQVKVDSPNYPANTLVECPEIQKLVVDAQSKGVTLKDYYLAKSELNKQYADCATIHNELVRFIKEQQSKKK